jgi:hypothetical protein
MLKKIVLIITLLLLGFAVSKSDSFKVFYAIFIQSNSIVELKSGNEIFDRYIGKRYCTTDILLKYKAFANTKSITFIESQYSFDNPQEYKYSLDKKYGTIIGELESGSELTMKRIFETETFHGRDHIFQLSINNTTDDNLYAIHFFEKRIKNKPISFYPPKYITDCPPATKTN